MVDSIFYSSSSSTLRTLEAARNALKSGRQTYFSSHLYSSVLVLLKELLYTWENTCQGYFWRIEMIPVRVTASFHPCVSTGMSRDTYFFTGINEGTVDREQEGWWDMMLTWFLVLKWSCCGGRNGNWVNMLLIWRSRNRKDIVVSRSVLPPLGQKSWRASGCSGGLWGQMTGLATRCSEDPNMSICCCGGREGKGGDNSPEGTGKIRGIPQGPGRVLISSHKQTRGSTTVILVEEECHLLCSDAQNFGVKGNSCDCIILLSHRRIKPQLSKRNHFLNYLYHNPCD